MSIVPDVLSPPANQFEAFAPSSNEPWDVPRASHLLRRLAFGPTRQRLDAALKQSPTDAVDSLLNYDPTHDPFADMADQMQGLFNLQNVDQVQLWWIYRMLYSTQPAQERIALFWHGHFATSATKVGNGTWMQGQIDLFRRQGLGSFRDLLIGVQRDPAMLVWLDGASNRKGKANENFGREVMELFTLGVGNYTEDDVKQIARAFTGWQIENNQGVFRKYLFDQGDKTIFGKTFNFDAISAINLILLQPSAPKFISRKLLRGFVHPQPSDEQINHYADQLLLTDWNIKAVLRQMITSRMFFSPWAYRARIKNPAELCIGSALALGGRPNTQYLRESMSKMGQNILYPPNVKGWDGEEAWINSNTVLERFNFAMGICTQRPQGGQNEMAKRSDLDTPLKPPSIETANDVIDVFGRVLLDGKVPTDTRQQLADFLNHDERGNLRPLTLNASTIDTKVRDMLAMMMSTPEYQLA